MATRRGDIWNPISFNEVYAPTKEIQFATAGGGFRTPWGWTIGAKGYYDVKGGRQSGIRCGGALSKSM
ncbi:MAG: hypothetical protein QM706_05545 [Nitrospira sp.]